MSTALHAGHVHNAEINRDPTQTTTLRRRFERDLSSRIRRIKGIIRTTVGYENDALGLSANAEPREVFDFPTDPEKQTAFLRWINRVLGEELVEVENFSNVREGRHFTAKYVRSSYVKAVQDAGGRLRAEGFDVPDQDVETIFNLPVHESSLRRIYTRTYENLEGISDASANVIRRELTQGIAEGVNPRVMASRINSELDTINLTRARTLARTEVIHSYSTGTLDRYERFGVGEVTVSAEFSTAGDNRVCPLCASQEGRVHTISEARTGTFEFDPGDEDPPSLQGTYPINPPIHPACRCVWLPRVS